MDNVKTILYRLERELRTCNSFSFDLSSSRLPSIEECLTFLELNGANVELENRQYKMAVIYDILFRTYPIIKSKIKPCIFESWAINHDVQELRKLLKIKEGSKENEKS